MADDAPQPRRPEKAKGDGDPLRRGIMGDTLRHAGAGIQFFLILAVCGGAGWWLDELLGWFPWLLTGGLLTGSVVAFVVLLREVYGAGIFGGTTDETTGRRDAADQGAEERAGDGP